MSTFSQSRLGLEAASLNKPWNLNLESAKQALFPHMCSEKMKYDSFLFFCFSSQTASLRSELNHIHASAIEHLRQTHQQESAAAKLELENTLENNQTQVRNWMSQGDCLSFF